jgi:CRISPR type I-E-associated protein CasB/Cse2
MTTTNQTPGGIGMAKSRDPINELISETLARRDADARYRAAVSRGIEETTEHYAYPWVLRYVEAERTKAAYLRSAALCASFPDVPQASRPLGASLRALSQHRSKGEPFNPAEPDVVASRLIVLQEQDVEGAAATIRRFLDLARGSEIGFDFYGIGRLLTRWGNGFTDASQRVRRQPLGDYYGAWTTAGASKTTTRQENS